MFSKDFFFWKTIYLDTEFFVAHLICFFCFPCITLFMIHSEVKIYISDKGDYPAFITGW